MHFAFGSTLSRFDCLLCPLRSLSANALRLRLSSLAVYRVERVQVSVKSKKKQPLWTAHCCGAVYASQTAQNAPACSCTQHFVLRLLAMSTALDVRKCFALASLFACGHESLGSLHLTKKVSTDNFVLTFLMVRSPRLELGRCNHTPLKRTRLPIPP